MTRYRCPICARLVDEDPLESPTAGILCIDGGSEHVVYERGYSDEPLAKPELVGAHRVGRPEV